MREVQEGLDIQLNTLRAVYMRQRREWEALVVIEEKARALMSHVARR